MEKAASERIRLDPESALFRWFSSSLRGRFESAGQQQRDSTGTLPSSSGTSASWDSGQRRLRSDSGRRDSMLSEMQPGGPGGLQARYPGHSMAMTAMSNTAAAASLGMVSPQLSSLYNSGDYYRSVSNEKPCYLLKIIQEPPA